MSHKCYIVPVNTAAPDYRAAAYYRATALRHILPCCGIHYRAAVYTAVLRYILPCCGIYYLAARYRDSLVIFMQKLLRHEPSVLRKCVSSSVVCRWVSDTVEGTCILKEAEKTEFASLPNPQNKLE